MAGEVASESEPDARHECRLRFAASASVSFPLGSMKRRLPTWLIVMLTGGVFGMITSCSRESASDSATRELLSMEAVYRGSDVKAAEAALIAYAEHLADGQRRGVKGHDYPLGLGMTHGRLFILYRHTGQQDLMRTQYSLSVSQLRRWREAQKRPERALDPEDLAQWVEKYDEGLGVQWKTKRVADEQGRAQPDGPATGSQPIRSETNRTSGAAGSRR